MMPRSHSIAIIGAGPAGLAFALALHQQGIKCDIYEIRPAQFASRAAYAAVSLQPNGLRILDNIDVYNRVRPRSFNIETMYINDLATGKVMTEGAGIEKAYGYKRLRIYRSVLLQELQAAVAEQGMTIQYGHKFSHIVSENDEGVTFAFANGTQKTADLLIGADGIHSRVRAYVARTVQPTYSGLVGLGAEVPLSTLGFSADHDASESLPVTTKRGRTVVNLVPQDGNGQKIFVGRGRAMDSRPQEEWDALEADLDAMKQFYSEDLEGFPDHVRSAITSIDPSKTYLWPVHTMLRLGSWISEGKRVVFLGDAAHALSPITGQGVNQAFEDAYMLALVLANVSENVPNQEALVFWQNQRMKRVHELVDRLMSPGAQKGPQLETKSKIMAQTDDAATRGDAWLYEVNIKKAVDTWVCSTV